MDEPKKRGFAAMTPEQRSEISRKGGRRAHELGTAHKWNQDEAAAAGVKGGTKTQAERRIAREAQRQADAAVSNN